MYHNQAFTTQSAVEACFAETQMTNIWGRNDEAIRCKNCILHFNFHKVVQKRSEHEVKDSVTDTSM